MRRRSFVHLALLAAVIAADVTAVAVVIPWLPISASKEGNRIDLTYWLATGISIMIFSVVAARQRGVSPPSVRRRTFTTDWYGSI